MPEAKKVRLLTSIASAGWAASPGQVLRTSADEADRLVKAELAEPVAANAKHDVCALEGSERAERDAAVFAELKARESAGMKYPHARGDAEQPTGGAGGTAEDGSSGG